MFFAGMAQGFSAAQTEDRKLQAQIDENTAQRENAALLHLSQIPGEDNADIRAHALSAMLNPQRTPGGFMASLTNQNKKNPMLPTIQALMQQGVQKPVMQQTEPGPTAAPVGTAPPPGELGIPQTTLGAAHNMLPQAPAVQAQVGTQTVPRRFPSGPEVAGETSFQQAKNHLAGIIAGATASGADPTMAFYAEANALGMRPTHFVDDQGNATFYMGNIPVGSAAGIGKPAAPVERIKTEAANIGAANAPPPGMTPNEVQARTGEASALAAKQQTTVTGAGTAQSRATTAAATAATAQPLAAAKLTSAEAAAAVAPEMQTARLAQARQSTATQEARMESLRANTVTAWQRANGTVPMNRQQAMTTARQVLGNDPSVTAGDVGLLGDRLFASTQRGGGGGGAVHATIPPPATGTAPAAPAGPPGARPGSAGPLTPAPAAAAPGGPPGPLQGAIQGAGLAETARNFKSYSPAGKQTLLALGTVERLLPRIEAEIRKAGLANSNNPIPNKIAQTLYSFGISPGADMEALLQNAGMSKAYGLRGLLGGRSNQQLQGIYGQHLIDGGDAPKLILQKIRTLRANFPDIRAAIDEAEMAHIGGKSSGATSPPPPAVMRARDAQGKLHEAAPGTPLPAGWTREP